MHDYLYKICSNYSEASSCASDLMSYGISCVTSDVLETDANGTTRTVYYIYISKKDRFKATPIGRLCYNIMNRFGYVIIAGIVIIALGTLVQYCTKNLESQEQIEQQENDDVRELPMSAGITNIDTVEAKIVHDSDPNSRQTVIPGASPGAKPNIPPTIQPNKAIVPHKPAVPDLPKKNRPADEEPQEESTSPSGLNP